MARWISLVERWRRLILLASVALCALCGLSLTRLRLDLDLIGTLPRGRPAFDDFKALITDFGQLDELILLLEGGAPDDLKAMAEAVADRLRDLARIESVDVRIDVDAIGAVILDDYPINYLNDAGFDALEKRLNPEGIDRQLVANRSALAAPLDLSVARTLANDPLGIRRLVLDGLNEAFRGRGGFASGGYYMPASADALLVMVRPRGSAFDIAFSRALLDDVHAAVDAVRSQQTAWAPIGVRYTGSYAFALEDAATLRGDINLFVGLSLGGVLLVFLFGYRSIRILPFVTYPLIVTTLVTFALSLLLFDQLNALSISFAAILYGLSIDSGIHFYTRLMFERRTQPLREAVVRTLEHLGVANLVASATTAAVFCVAGLSCLSAVSQLGWMTAVGMLVNSALFFVLYPALALALPPASESAIDLRTPRLGRLGEWCAKHSRTLLVVAALLTALAALQAVEVVSDVHLTRLRPSESEAGAVQERIAAKFSGRSGSAALLIDRSDAETALRDTEAVGGLLRRYRDQGLVESASSVESLLTSVQTQQRRLARFNAIDRRRVAAMLRESLPKHGFKLERFQAYLESLEAGRTAIVRPGDPALRTLTPVVEHHLRQRNGRWIAATWVEPSEGIPLDRIAARLRADLKSVPHRFAARGLLEAELSDVLQQEFVLFIGLAVVGNLLLLLLMLRSLRTALAVLLPVAVASVVLFAVMAVAGIPLDPVNLIVVPMVLGLGVDYGVYVAAGMRERSIGTALQEGGRALCVTALTTIAGFGFLGLSHYPALASLGILTGIGLFVALILTIVLLPAVIGPAAAQSTSIERE